MRKWLMYCALFMIGCITALQAADIQGETVFTMTIIHLSDTHSKLDPTLLGYKIDVNEQMKQQAVYAETGGIDHVMSAVAAARKSAKNVLVLHAGDMFQGTLYFTKYLGRADIDFFNMMKIDAMTLGNHEFDKGPELINNTLLKYARFPVTSANVDFSGEPVITAKNKLFPYVIKKIGGEKIAIIGVTTLDTANISSPGKNIRFNDAAASIQKYVDQLTAKKINKIIVLSHLGIDEDEKLAPKLHGVDVIVGGHSHTLLGEFVNVGISAYGPYPIVEKDSEGKTVLIVHSNEWGKILGDLQVGFDKNGEITAYTAAPRFVISTDYLRVNNLPDLTGAPKRVEYTVHGTAASINEYNGSGYTAVPAGAQYDGYLKEFDAIINTMKTLPDFMITDSDPKAAEQLAKYAKGIEDMKGETIATIGEDLERGLNKGPGILVADAMRQKTGTDLAATNPGGVRTNLIAGPFTVAGVYELLPFGNRLVIVQCSGSDIRNIIEDMADFQINKAGVNGSNPYIYLSGATFTFTPAAAKGTRVSEIKILQKDGSYKPVDPDGTYTFTVNNYMADGGDSNTTLKNITAKTDTGFIDAEVFMEYIKGKTLTETKEKRITVK